MTSIPFPAPATVASGNMIANLNDKSTKKPHIKIALHKRAVLPQGSLLSALENLRGKAPWGISRSS